MPSNTPSHATPHSSSGACTSAKPDITKIQPGGIGALPETFAPRWGDGQGAAGTEYLGQYPRDGGPYVASYGDQPADNDPRIWDMRWMVDSTQHASLDLAKAIAWTILPRDAVEIGQEQRTQDAVTITYCSAAILAAFPPGTMLNGDEMPTDGQIVVEYTLRADGSIDSIACFYATKGYFDSRG